MKALARQGLCAAAAFGVFAFWGGLWMASHRYPSGYDWRYMTMSNLVYADRNPDGYLWAWGGVVLCALGGLCWTAALIGDWRHEGAARLPIGIWALVLGYLCMVCCALLRDRLLEVPRSHEILALAAFFGLCIGIVQLTFKVAVRSFRRRKGRVAGAPRLYAGLLAGVALSPVLTAGIAQAYVSHALPELPWVGPEWRARGVSVYLSFAFWEWITCAVFSAYTTSLCLASMTNFNRHAHQRPGERDQFAP
jgi:hypothetical protein